MTVALYTRVSRDIQDINKQVDTLLSWSKKHNKEFELFKDPGYIGEKFDRPGFNDMIELVKEGRFDSVVLYKLDRMGRNVLGMLEFVNFLDEHNTKLISITENIDPSTPMGTAFMQMMFVFAELERSVIKERTIWGMNVIKERNKNKPKLEQHNLGRPPRGYSSKDGILFIQEKKPLEPYIGMEVE